MVSIRAKSVTTGCLLFVLLFCAVGAVTVSWHIKSVDCFTERLPLESLEITIEESQRELLIEQLRKFADQNDFKYQIVYYTQAGDNFSIWMKRKDVEVIVRNPFDPRVFKIGFYNYDCIHPTVASDVEGLANDLKSLISEVPNVKISEEK